MVCTYLDQYNLNEQGNLEPIIKVLFRVEIPRSEFTYLNAVNKIIELNDLFNFDHIAIDRGFGEVQLEMLHDYGNKNPETGLAIKTVGYQFGQKIDVRDPHTMKVDKKHMKPFMVNNSVITFERGKIILDPKDKILREQLEGYKIKSISSTGMPVYTDENEHGVDALNLCLLITEQNHGKLFKSVINSKIIATEGVNRQDEVERRILFLKEEEDSKPTIKKHKSFGGGSKSKGIMFKRGTF